MPFGSTLEPYASRAGFPSFGALVLLRRDRVKATDFDVQDDAVCFHELRFLLTLDMYVGMIEPAFVQVEVFLDAVPLLRIEFAAREEVEARTGCKGDVCDDEARGMRWEGIVDCVW